MDVRQQADVDQVLADDGGGLEADHDASLAGGQVAEANELGLHAAGNALGSPPRRYMQDVRAPHGTHVGGAIVFALATSLEGLEQVGSHPRAARHELVEQGEALQGLRAHMVLDRAGVGFRTALGDQQHLP